MKLSFSSQPHFHVVYKLFSCTKFAKGLAGSSCAILLSTSNIKSTLIPENIFLSLHISPKITFLHSKMLRKSDCL